MTRRRTVLLVAVALALSTGCAAHVPMATAEHDLLAKQFRAQPDKANLYVYRNERFGFAVSMSVLLDGVWLGDTAAETYLYVPVSAGPHQVVSKTEDSAEVSFNAEPGKNYFVWQEVKMGFASARSALHLVTEEQGRAAVAQCSLAKTNPSHAIAVPAGCTKDTDCKGNRICNSGACVDRKPSAPGTS